MASTSHNQTPSSSSSTLPPSLWDVFLSFRGTDTRDSFTDYLYHSLKRTGVRTFRDDPELRSGEVISNALLQAIQKSKMYVVVFSKNYASSPWCLDELVEIFRCYQSMDKLVLPVFYFIKPSVVKYQTGSFNEAFQTHESHGTRYDRDRLVKWRDTLKKVGNFSGYHVRKNMSQADIINEVVDRVLLEISPMTLDVAKYPVGLDFRVKDIATLLSNDTGSVVRIGIHGMGGVGKTTLAKAVYNQNYRRFQGSCFLENVREASETRKGIVCLQEKLVNDVLKCKNITIGNADQGIEFIKARICSTKVLIVIDDLDNAMPLEFLEGPFALGSTVIITTRYEDLLDSIKVEAKYKVNELGDAESSKLFCQHAFGDSRMLDTFSELSKEILERAGGLPLALKVCGSTLRNKSEEGWRWFISNLRRVSIVDVEKILLISFDALKLVDPMLQDIFLDIACFFIGHKKEECIEIMETCYTFVNHNIDILKKRSLLTINNRDELGMHDLLRDMGRKIACKNSPDEPGKHSRLWVSENIYDVLKEQKGTEAIESIISSRFYYRSVFVGSSPFTISIGNHFAAKTFKRMSKLRFLYLESVDLTGSFEHTFENLRWLHWHHCPLKCLPYEFYPQKLVFLDLFHSKLTTMWEPNKVSRVFKKLKTLNMSHSLDLTKITDFTGLLCLETLNLEGCKSLEEVHVSIGSLVRLISLNIRGCKKLKSLPDSICNLRALKSLNVSSCSNLEALPVELGSLESLTNLYAERLSVLKLPDSIGRIRSLENLKLNYCRNLLNIAKLPCNLKWISCQACSAMERLPKLSNLKQLEKLDLRGCSLLTEIQGLELLCNLKWISCEDCSALKTLPNLSNLRKLEELVLARCSGLTEIQGLELPCNLVSCKACRAMKKLPNLSNLKHLEKLDLKCCSGLTEIQGWEELVSIKALHLRGCNSSLVSNTFTKRFFQIYSGFGHKIKIYAPPSMFPDWISQTPDWTSQSNNSGLPVSLVLPPNVSHNLLAMILCFKHSEQKEDHKAYYVMTTTADCVWSDWLGPFDPFAYDYYNHNSWIIIVPRSIFSIRAGDNRIRCSAYLETCDKNTTANAEILGIPSAI